MTKNFFKRGLSREELIKTRSEYFRTLLKSDHRLKHCPEIKMCPGCSEILNLAEFGSNVREKDGYQSRCRACSRELYLKRRNITPVVEKLCLKCNQHLPASNFRKNILKKDGLKDNCISCSENKINQSFSVERILTERKKKTLLLRKIFYQQKLPEGDLKLCPLCEFPKSILEFTSSTSSKDGLGSTGVQGGVFENLYFLFEETSNKWLYLRAISSNKDFIEKVFNTYRHDTMSRYLYVTGKKILPVKSEEFNIQNVIPIPNILLHNKETVIKAIEHFFCLD